MEIKRGDIWYVRKDNYTGCEQAAGRPAYKGHHLTPAEMTNVEVAMLISLELEVGKPVEKIVEVTKEVPVIRDVKVSTPASNPNMAAELAAAKAKCEMLQTMYESLLNRVLAGKAG